MRFLPDDRQQRADVAARSHKPPPERDAKIAPQDLAKERMANPDVRCDRPAEITGQQDCTEQLAASIAKNTAIGSDQPKLTGMPGGTCGVAEAASWLMVKWPT